MNHLAHVRSSNSTFAAFLEQLGTVDFSSLGTFSLAKNQRLYFGKLYSKSQQDF